MDEAPGVETRRLQAIMFTDMFGFSKMMGEDEQRTIRLVEEHRAIVRAVLPGYAGREHQTIGDAFVVLFDSALNAVSCAVEIQKRMSARNEGKADNERVFIRIGIHLDDIVFKDGQIYGDGVNLAARVETQSEPGGICVTEPVLAHVKGKVTFGFVALGERALKNIARPPALYAVHVDGMPHSPVPAAAQLVTTTLAATSTSLATPSATTTKPRVSAPVIAGGAVAVALIVAAVALQLMPGPVALSSDPVAAGLYAEALVLQRDAQLGGAIDRLQQAVAKDPTLAAAQLRLAGLLVEEDPLIARDAYQAAARNRTRLDDKDRALFEAFGPYLAATVDLPGFQKALDGVAGEFDDDEVRYWQAFAHTLTGDHARARAIAAGGDAAFLPLLWIQGVAALHVEGGEEEGRAILQRCVQAAPSSTKCLEELIRLHSRMGRCGDMEAAARELVSRSPGDPDAERHLAYALAAQGVPLPSVVEVLKRVQRKVPVEQQPLSDAIHRTRVFAYAGAFAESEAAALEWQRLITAHPDVWMHVLPATYVVGARLEQGRVDDAGAAAADFLRTAPAFQKDAFGDDWSAFFENVLARGGRLSFEKLEERRAAWLDEQWAKQPRADRLVHLWRDAWGEWARDAQQAQAAKQALEKLRARGLVVPVAARLEPGLALALGQTLLRTGDVDGAVPLLEHAAGSCIDIYEPYRSMRAYQVLGEALLQKGDVDGARAAFSHVVDQWGAASSTSVTLAAARAGLASLPAPAPTPTP